MTGGDLAAEEPGQRRPRPATAAPRIFICYRRSDAMVAAEMLSTLLGERFGAENVFRDVHSIGPGDRWREQIEQSIARCDVFLALIGGHWLNAEGEQGRRLDSADDHVRIEIELALDRDIWFIPLLVDGTPLPEASRLPGRMARMLEHNARRLGPNSFQDDARRLVTEIAQRWRYQPSRVPRAAVPIVAGVLATAIAVTALIALYPPPQTPGGNGSPTTSAAPAVVTDPARIDVTYSSPPCNTSYTVTIDARHDPRIEGARALWLVTQLKADPENGMPNPAFYAKQPIMLEDGQATITFPANTTAGPPRNGRILLVVSPDDAANADLEFSRTGDPTGYPDGRRIELREGNFEIATTPFAVQDC